MTYRRDKEREIARGKEQADWYREHLEGSTELTDEDYGWLGVWDFASIDAVLEDVHPADQFEAERMMVSASYKLVNMVYRLLARIENLEKTAPEDAARLQEFEKRAWGLFERIQEQLSDFEDAA